MLTLKDSLKLMWYINNKSESLECFFENGQLAIYEKAYTIIPYKEVQYGRNKDN